MIEWLITPIDVSRAHDIPALLAWHARLMTLAWAILVPLGIIMARFFKVTRAQRWPEELDNAFWWNQHRLLQYASGIITVAALMLILVFRSGAANAAGLHGLLGWVVIALAVIQFTSSWLRGSKGGPTALAEDGSLRGDHYDMTLRRRVFEYVHKSVGYLAVAIATGAIVTGLWQANAPRWMWLVITLWWLIMLAAFAMLQRQGRAIDTYQAIWGPDTVHPGNQIPPIGWGIKRR